MNGGPDQIAGSATEMQQTGNRHARQIQLPQIGTEGQARLARAHVLIVGAGGLGSPAIMYLAGAGIGSMTVVDPDTVETHNLHRQPIHAGRVGWGKAASAAAFVERLDARVGVTPLARALTPANAAALVAEAQVVLDCADSFAVSYMLSDACQAAEVPLISASALGLSGYCGGFCGQAPSLRAVFPDLPDRAATCATAGVLGPVVGILGAMQAQMALAVLLGLTPSPLGQLVTLGDGLRPGGFRFDGAPEPATGFRFIDRSEITPGDLVVDLRGESEAPAAVTATALRGDADAPPLPAPGQRAVYACRSGLRAWRAARHASTRTDNIVLIATGDTP